MQKHWQVLLNLFNSSLFRCDFPALFCNPPRRIEEKNQQMDTNGTFRIERMEPEIIGEDDRKCHLKTVVTCSRPKKGTPFL